MYFFPHKVSKRSDMEKDPYWETPQAAAAFSS